MATKFKTRFGDILEEESSEEGEYQEKLQSSVYLARITPLGKILWQQQIDEVGDFRADVEATKRLASVSCLGFRSMLPMCPGIPPARSSLWVRTCIRSMLVCLAFGEDSVRFPGLVYHWYSTKEDQMNQIEGLSLQSGFKNSNERDDDRWAIYYGSKNLAKTYPEALLFFQLLEEEGGKDSLDFVRHILLQSNEVVPSLERYWVRSVDELDRVLQRLGREEVDPINSEQKLMIPLNIALQLLSNSSPTRVTHNEKQAMDLSIDIDGNMYVDLFEIIMMILSNYNLQVRHRTAYARLLYETAATGALTKYVPKNKEEATSNSKNTKQAVHSSVSYAQFQAIVEALWPSIEAEEASDCFLTNGVSSFKRFCEEARRRSFFYRSWKSSSERAKCKSMRF